MSADAPNPEDLEALVGRTRGLQPFRRLFHAVSGIAVAVIVESFGFPAVRAAWILLGLFLVLLLGDWARLKLPGVNALFFRVFARVASPREQSGPASSTWYALGLSLSLFLFPPRVAVSGIIVLALADPIASYSGRRWGRRPFMGGSVEGTIIFVLVAFAVLAWRHPWPIAAAAAVVATLAERRSWPLDDNLAVPLATGAALWLLSLIG